MRTSLSCIPDLSVIPGNCTKRVDCACCNKNCIPARSDALCASGVPVGALPVRRWKTARLFFVWASSFLVFFGRVQLREGRRCGDQLLLQISLRHSHRRTREREERFVSENGRLDARKLRIDAVPRRAVDCAGFRRRIGHAGTL